MHSNRLYLVIICFFLLVGNSFSIVLKINKGSRANIKIAVSPFISEKQFKVHEIINFNLARTGLFDVLKTEDMLSYPRIGDHIYFHDWRMLEIDYLLIGKVEVNANNQFDIVFQLIEVFSEKIILEGRESISNKELRVKTKC